MKRVCLLCLAVLAGSVCVDAAAPLSTTDTLGGHVDGVPYARASEPALKSAAGKKLLQVLIPGKGWKLT